MKKYFNLYITIACIVVVLGVGISGYKLGNLAKDDEKINNFYAQTTIVEEVHEANDLVTVRDFNGNLWQFKGIEDWEAGDICSIIFNSKGTENIEDDEIVSVRYSGWIDGWK